MEFDQSQGDMTIAVVKPLLSEALGVPFLAYVLCSSESEIESWLLSSDDNFGTASQTVALGQLHLVLSNPALNNQPEARQLNISNILAIYQEPFQTTLVNVIRAIAENRQPEHTTMTTPEEILSKIVSDVYPLYLLPSDSQFPTFSVASLYQHPLRRDFESKILDDPAFKDIFPANSDSYAPSKFIFRSSGQGSGIQLVMFAEMLIKSGWRAANIVSIEMPNLAQHEQATLDQLRIIRQALAGTKVRVPARIAFTGVRLEENEEIDLGWGILRAADKRDEQLAPGHLKGQITGTRSDGSSVVVDYSGNVILDTQIDYKIKVGSFNPEQAWPQELNDIGGRVFQRVESIKLGALLSEKFDPNETVTVLSAWQYMHDPLSHGYDVGSHDTKSGKSFMPRVVNSTSAEQWKTLILAIEDGRTKSIDVAIRRTLRAASERTDFADVLVDSVIAWENLVGSQQGEPTLRVSGALAWLLENKDVEKRMLLRREIGKLYHERSKVVHGSESSTAHSLVPKAHRALEIAIDTLRILFTTRRDLLDECKSGDDRSNKLLMGG